MKAELLPLNGKYYGTEIQVTDGDKDTVFKIWCNADYKPSDRELAACGVTRKQYDNNELVGTETWGESTYEVMAKDQCEVCDSHFESDWTYNLAQKIIEAINS